MTSSGSKKIIIATGIFPPDIGGPATYIPELAKRLEESGFSCEVVTYSDQGGRATGVRRVSRALMPLFRHIVYLLELLFASRSADIMYAMDATAAGLPALITARLFGLKFFLRIGGDVVWERTIGDDCISVREYYAKGMHKRSTLYQLSRMVIERAQKVITPSTILVEIYRDFYGIPQEKLFFLPNPFPSFTQRGERGERGTVLFAGRLQRYKNIEALMLAFDATAVFDKQIKLHIIGTGPDEERLKEIRESLSSKDRVIFEKSLPHEELIGRIKDCMVAVAPSVTEFSPNFVLETLAQGKPIIISKENGLGIDFPDEFIFTSSDPNELASKLRMLLQPSAYERAQKWVERLPKSWGWNEIAEKHIELFRSK